MVVRISATYSRGQVPMSIAPTCSVTICCMFCTTGHQLPNRPIARNHLVGDIYDLVVAPFDRLLGGAAVQDGAALHSSTRLCQNSCRLTEVPLLGVAPSKVSLITADAPATTNASR
jgi:hypothetical protein